MATEPQPNGGYLLEVLGPGCQLIGLRPSREVAGRIMQDEPGPLQGRRWEVVTRLLMTGLPFRLE